MTPVTGAALSGLMIGLALGAVTAANVISSAPVDDGKWEQIARQASSIASAAVTNAEGWRDVALMNKAQAGAVTVLPNTINRTHIWGNWYTEFRRGAGGEWFHWDQPTDVVGYYRAGCFSKNAKGTWDRLRLAQASKAAKTMDAGAVFQISQCYVYDDTTDQWHLLANDPGFVPPVKP